MSLEAENERLTRTKESPVSHPRVALANVTNSKMDTGVVHAPLGISVTKKRAVYVDSDEEEDQENHKRSRVGSCETETALETIPETPRADTRVPLADKPRWKELDAEDAADPMMVADYSNDIFAHFYSREEETLATSYFQWQEQVRPRMRGILCDWLVEVHGKFNLLPETLFLAINVMDRFMSKEAVQVDKLQLLATTSLFIAAKYEEVFSPKIDNFAYITDGSSSTEEIVTAERFMLTTLEFDIGTPNPMNFLRRISKGDEYDLRTRTLGKYFLELCYVDHKFLGTKGSLLAAASMYLARKCAGKTPAWDVTLEHYAGGYKHEEMVPVLEKMLKCLVQPSEHEHFFKKYSKRKFMKVSLFAKKWATEFIEQDGEL